MPFLFRLPEFPARDAGQATDRIVNQCVKDVPDKPHHLVIIGNLCSGKTSLAVGIGTEVAFAHHVVRYLTFSKLRQIGMGAEPAAPRNTKLWPWRSSELLIIDDVVFDVDKEHSPEDLPEMIRGFTSELATRSVVWVLDTDSRHAAAWVRAIEDAIPIGKDSVDLVVLSKSAADRALVAHLAEPRKQPLRADPMR